VSADKIDPSRPNVTFLTELVPWTVTSQVEPLRLPRRVLPFRGDSQAMESGLAEPPDARVAPVSRA
jgi:hypothetical protein